jgi:multisubunit Na+/H+ antiporter MnhF subunit
MTAWLAAILALLPPFAIACHGALTGGTARRLVGVELASSIAVLLLVLMSFAFSEPSFIDLPLALAFLSVPGTLLYAHFMERWL